MSEKYEQVWLDCAGWQSKEQLHKELKEALRFPDWYGNNLDALHDLLTEMSGIELVLDHTGALKENMGAYGQSLLRVVMDSARENKGFRAMLRP